jgi:hypothetical protein
MPGKSPRLNPLQSRKQLLLAESALNRVQMAGDMAVMVAGVRTLHNRAKSIESITSSAAMLLTGLAAFQRARPTDVKTKSCWWQIVLKGAGLISTLWLASRPQTRDRNQI